MSPIKIIKLLDKYFGTVICIFLSFLNKTKGIKSIKEEKVLFIQLWGIGESVLTLPTLKIFKEHYPKVHLNILVTERNKDVYEGQKFIDNIICLKLNPISLIIFIIKNYKKYDIVIDMEEYLNISSIISFFIGRNRVGYDHNIRSGCYTNTVKYNDNQHASQTFLDLLQHVNIKVKSNTLINLNYTSKDKKNIDSILTKFNTNRIICIVPGAAESAHSRMWPKEKFSILINQILKNKKNISVILTGNNKEKDLNNEIIKNVDKNDNVINLAGKITINELFCLVKKCILVISNDTGPMHIAAAQGTKTVGLFGPNLPTRFRPLNKKSISIYKKNICEYSPCINVHKGEVPDCLYPKNSEDYQKCMKAISVEDVIKKI